MFNLKSKVRTIRKAERKDMFKKSKGITLIALVITIIVLLLLAGVSIAVLTGENGVLTQADKAKVEQSHAAIKDAISLAYNEYKIIISTSKNTKEVKEELKVASTNKVMIQGKQENQSITKNSTFKEFLLEKEYITADGKIQVEKLLGQKQALGNGDGDEETKKDVYMFEEVDNNYVVYYYNKEGEPEEKLWQSNETTEQTPNPNPPEETGNYLLNNETYYNTLNEALQSATDGSTIQVTTDVTETEETIIDKSVTIDTNGKTINYDGDYIKITINEGKNVVIKGNGTIVGKTTTTFILNYGNLETNEVTIQSSTSGHLSSAIVSLSPGKVVANNSNITGISCEGLNGSGVVTINGGEYGYLAGYPSGAPGTFIINDGKIETISLIKGGTCVINGGEVNNIILGNDSGDIDLTIGDINKEVNTNSPKVNNMEISSGDLAGIKSVINFYNGILNGFYDNVRPGYKVENTAGGSILVKE